MTYSNEEVRAKYLIESSDQNSEGFFVTLVGLTRSQEKFDEQLLTLSLWVNDYCLGRSFIQKKERLQIFGAVERGDLNHRLHAHLIIKKHPKVKRSDQALNAYVRKSWIKLINLLII